MNREEIKKAVANAVVDFAKSEAEAAIKSIDLDDVQKLVEAQMKNLTDTLEAEYCVPVPYPEEAYRIRRASDMAESYQADVAGCQVHRRRSE